MLHFFWMRWSFFSFVLVSGKLSRWLTFLLKTFRSTKNLKIVLNVICVVHTRLFIHSGSLGSGIDCNNLTVSWQQLNSTACYEFLICQGRRRVIKYHLKMFVWKLNTQEHWLDKAYSFFGKAMFKMLKVIMSQILVVSHQQFYHQQKRSGIQC